MNICIPIEKDRGLKSPICLHFGTAPKFLIIDCLTMEYQVVDNLNTVNDNQKSLIQCLVGYAVKSVMVNGINLDSLHSLQSANISVFSSTEDTVEAIVNAYNANKVNPVTLGEPCSRKVGDKSFSIPVCGKGPFNRRGGGCLGGC